MARLARLIEHRWERALAARRRQGEASAALPPRLQRYIAEVAADWHVGTQWNGASRRS